MSRLLQVKQKRAAAPAQRMSSAEAFLARVSANAAAEGSCAAEEPSTSGALVGPAHTQELVTLPPYQQQRSHQGMQPGLPLRPPSQPPAKQQKQHHLQQPGHHEVPHDQLTAAAAATAHGPHCQLTSPQSAATSSPVGGPHQEVSSNSGVGSGLSGRPRLEPSPFSSTAVQGSMARPPVQGAQSTGINVSAFGSTQLVHSESGVAAIQQQQHSWPVGSTRSAPAAALSQPRINKAAGGFSLGFGGGNAHSLQLSASSGRSGEVHTSNPSLVGELQLLGLCSGSVQLGGQALPPHLQAMASYTRQTAAAAQLAAADYQQVERLGALRLLQQFPHAALHGGYGALQQLLSAGDSFGAPGDVSAAPAGQLQQVAALQAQQQAAQLTQMAALERYRRDQLQYQQLQQQLMQPFGGFAQPAQAPAYQQPTRGCGGGTGSAVSVGMAGPGVGTGLPGLPIPVDGPPFRICPSLGIEAGSSGGAGGHRQALNSVLAANPHAGGLHCVAAKIGGFRFFVYNVFHAFCFRDPWLQATCQYFRLMTSMTVMPRTDRAPGLASQPA